VRTACIICHNQEGNEIIELKELQLGLGEKFHYQLCGACCSLQLLDPPADFSRFYPNEEYYSFKMDMRKLDPPGYLRTAKAGYLLYGKNKLVGSLLSIGYKLPEYYTWMKGVHARPGDAILDVGCGNGSLLTKLYKMGFTNLTGIDPFIEQPPQQTRIRILKKDIAAMDEKFDVIMMHHALEHMADPLGAMKKAHSLLNENKYLLVRIPVMGNYGWNKYREYWAGLDAPRHLFIPSEKAMRLLAEQAGFELEKLEYDTVDYLIWCSEQYKHGISLYDERSRMVNRKKNMFSEKQISSFKKILADANAKNYGDTAAFYLRKIHL
jgi:SAM-dependent methyltransferase